MAGLLIRWQTGAAMLPLLRILDRPVSAMAGASIPSDHPAMRPGTRPAFPMAGSARRRLPVCRMAHPQVVLHVGDTKHNLGAILRPPLRPT